MKGERRDKADHALGKPFGRLSEAVICIELCVGKLIESARQPDHLAVLFHAANRCGGDAGFSEFRKSHNPTRREEIAGYLALRPGPGHRYIFSHFSIHSARFCITRNGERKDKASFHSGNLFEIVRRKASALRVGLSAERMHRFG